MKKINIILFRFDKGVVIIYGGGGGGGEAPKRKGLGKQNFQ